MKEKINIIKRKNILILLFLNIIIISLILSMVTKIEVKQMNIGIVKKEINTKVEIMPETSKTRLLGLRDSSLKTLEKYRNEYRNSIIYGTIAYILHMLSLISIPILVILLIVSYVYDSVIGLKTRSLYNKGRLIRFHVLTFFVACQLMPLIFATVIKGWGN